MYTYLLNSFKVYWLLYVLYDVYTLREYYISKKEKHKTERKNEILSLLFL